jgi:hypothetical protein
VRLSRNPLGPVLLGLLLGAGVGFGLAGCSEDPEGPEGPPPSDCPPQSVLTFENFGEPFLMTWCTPCHSSHLADIGDPNDRQDAPVGADFDTYDHYIDWDAKVYDRAAGTNTQMPPAGGPTEEERTMLAEWIACGSPQ